MLTSIYASTQTNSSTDLGARSQSSAFQTHVKITAREQEVLHLIAHEHSSKEIAAKLYVSHETVNSHRKNMMDKLGVRNTAGLIRAAFEKGIMRVGQVACLLLFLFINSTEAQVTNDNKINWQFKIERLDWNQADEGPDGRSEEDPTWLFRWQKSAFSPALDCDATDFDDSPFVECFNYQNDWGPHYPDHTLYNETDVLDNTKIYVAYRAGEDDGGGVCFLGGNVLNSDDYIHCSPDGGLEYDAKFNDPCQENLTTYTDGGTGYTDYRWGRAWRFTDGNSFTSALDFGQLSSNGTVFHVNSNRSNPSGYDSDMGYTNVWSAVYTGGQDGSDVFYSFTIPNGTAKRVVISTDHATTDFDTYIHLIKWNSSNSTFNDVDRNDDIDGTNNRQSLITQDLCGGEYRIIVEGFGSTTGDFRLNVTVSDVPESAITGGSISADASNLNICEGVPLPGINNTVSSTENIYNTGFDDYEWEKRVGTASFQTVSGENADSLAASATGDMETDNVSFRRRGRACDVVGEWSNVVTFQFQPSSVQAGEIEFNWPQQYSRKDYILPTSITNKVDAFNVDPVANPNKVYRWTKKVGDNTDVDTIMGGALGTTPLNGNIAGNGNIGLLTEDTRFRRIAFNGCGNSDETDELVIRAIEADGVISGKVTSPPAGAGTGIEGVMVCATPMDNEDLYGLKQVCDETDAGGNYSIGTLYYGLEEVDYVVSTFLEDHVIKKPEDINNPDPNDSTYIVPVSSNSKINGGRNFEDLTVYTLNGNVSQMYSGTDYGKMGVIMNLTNIQGIPVGTPDTTDENGNYDLIIPNPGRYIIKPKFEGMVAGGDIDSHLFDPPLFDTIILGNIVDLNFKDLSTARIDGSILGGCEKFIGNVDIRIRDIESENGATNGFERIVTTDGSGEFNEVIPARQYKVQVLQNTLSNVPASFSADDIKDQFQALPIYEMNMNFEDTTLIEVYKAPPVVEFEGVPLPICGTIPIIEQFVSYPDFKIKVWEGPIANNCPLDTGFVEVNISGTNFPNPFPVSKGKVLGFQLSGGRPNIIAPYTHKLSVTGRDLKTNNSDIEEQDYIVTGENPKGQSFFTASPQVPLFILHDPPTDGGYSFLEKNRTRTWGLRTFSKESKGGGVWGELKLGIDQDLSFGIGVQMGFDVAVWGTVDNDISGTNTVTSATETVFSVQTNERYETSNTTNGDDADIFVSGAINYSYSKTDKLEVDPSTCDVILSESATFNPDSISTFFTYSTIGVKDQIKVIQDLKAIDLASADPEHSEAFYDSQINAWENMLLLNQKNKEAAIAKGGGDNVSISGGITQSFSKTIQADTMTSVETLIEIDEELGIGAGFEIAGTGMQGRAYFKFRHEFTPKDNPATDTLESNSTTTGYVFSDSEDNDRFSIDIYEDPQFGTPLFDLQSSTTSCPYELWDAGNPGEHTNEFAIAPKAGFPVQATNVDPNIGQEFRLIVKNNSLLNTTNFVVYPDAVFNSNGALILIQGQSGQVTLVNIGPGDEAEVSITVRQDPAIKVSNHQIRIRVEPECTVNGNLNPDREYSKSIDLNVTFLSDCSSIDMIEPQPGRIVNLSDNGILPITMRDYDKSKMTRVNLEYRPTGAASSAWTASPTFVYTPDQLSDLPVGDTKNWQLTDIPEDGPYDIRLTVICDGGSTNGSAIVPIVIDRTPPEVFGLPSPIDDVYDQANNDELSVTYNEEVCDNGATGASATIIDLVTGDEIPGIVSCNGNTIKIVESGTSLNNRAPSAYRVILSGVSDLNGNMADTYRWVFIVGAYSPEELGCIADLEIVNNNENQDAINVSTYRALSIISDGEIPNFGTTSYNAENAIVLNNNFTVNQGGVFEANIETCSE